MNYDVDYFINKFEAIPDEKWTTNKYERNGQYCAYGHCGMRGGFAVDPEPFALKMLFKSNDFAVIEVNDGLGHMTKFGNSPKNRIMNVLKEIKGKQV